MATLAQVRRIAKRGDKREAAQELQSLLKQKPSADAWVFAAELANNPEKSAKFLQRALQMNPNHRQAKQQLAKLKKGSSSAKPQRKRAATPAGGGSMSRSLKFALTLVGSSLLVMLVFMGIGALVTQQIVANAEAEEEFVPAQTLIISPDTVVQQFKTYDVPGKMRSVSIQDGTTTALQKWELVMDEGVVTLYMYPNIESMPADRVLWYNQIQQDHSLMTFHTVAMLYPTNLSDQSVNIINRKIQTIPLNEQVEVIEVASSQ